MASRLGQAAGIITTLRRAGMIAPMRSDRYLKMAAAMRRDGMGSTVGFASAAQRCPVRPGLVDELGILTWRQLDERIDALAAALQRLPAGRSKVIAIMCRNHRGFVEAMVAAKPDRVRRPAAQHVVRRACSTGKILRAELQARVDG
jgi:AMP-binding enzyme